MWGLRFEYNHIKAGAIGGLVGGVVFGAMMGMMGMLPMVAKLVGGSTATLGFLVHIVISVIFGIGFAVLFGHVSVKRKPGIVWGLVYGFALWIIGPLVLMPMALGAGARLNLTGATAALPSLWGHLVFGFILGFLFSVMSDSEKPHQKEA